MKRLLVAAAFAAAATLTFGSSAFAWKPYTHVQSGLTARADAVDDGKVAVAGKSYPVDSRVVDARATGRATTTRESSVRTDSRT